MAALDRPGSGASVPDLYRAVWDSLRPLIVRYRLVLAVELGMIALWFVLRTTVSVESRPYVLWTIVAAGIAVVSPTSGLVILAGTAPFFEPVSLSRVLGMRHVLVAVLGISVALRLVAGGWRRMPWSPPVFLAIAIGVLTAIGVWVTSTRFSTAWTQTAAQTWLSSVGGAMIILVVAVWVARDGSRRAVVAAVGSATIAIALSVADQLQRGSISQGPLAWIGFWKDFGVRLTGAIPSPNGMAALAVMPVCILTAFALLASGRRGLVLAARVGAGGAATVLFLAMYLTFSRAAILSLFGLAVALAWRINRRLGQIVAVGGIIAGLALLPSYLALRGQVGAGGVLQPGSLLVASDALRLQAWSSVIQMWSAEPITGQGFLAYKQLADTFGDAALSSPHNEWLRLFAEEGVAAGTAGVVFVATTIWALGRRHDPLDSGILAGAFGWFLMASFNNPLLFVQVSAVAFSAVGYGLARAVGQTAQSGDRDALPTEGRTKP